MPRAAPNMSVSMIEPDEEEKAGSAVLLPNTEEIEETPSDRVARILMEARDEDRAVVKLFRLDGAKWEWCADYPVTEFESGGFEMVRQQWGHGTYEIRVYGTKPGSNYYGVRGRVTIKIAKSSVPVPTGEPSDIATLAKMMQEQNAAIIAALTARPETPQRDPMAEMMQMFTLMKTMREAMGETAQPKSQISEIIAAVREMREVSAEINPPAESSDSPMAVFGQILPIVKDAMAQRTAAQQFPAIGLPPSMIAPPVMPPAPAPVPTVTPAVTPLPEIPPSTPQTPQPSEEQMIIFEMRKQLSEILAMSTNGTPEDAAIDHVYQTAPDEIIEAMQDTQWFEMLSTLAPEALSHKEWLTRIRDGVLEAIKQDEEEDALMEARQKAMNDALSKPGAPVAPAGPDGAPSEGSQATP